MGKAICVYCASSSDVPEAYFEAARRLGVEMARRGHTLVYGGGNVGLMGALALAVQGAGGRVVGVIPHVLRRRELALESCDELIVTRTMHERKAMMAHRADAFIALPGGFGTFEEILEVITHRQLGLHGKPCILVNLNNYYSGLIEQFERAIAESFASSEHRRNYRVAMSVEEALAEAERA